MILRSYFNMSPELETLDQLLGSELSLNVIIRLFPDGSAFKRGVLGLIDAGDVCLVAKDGSEIPHWRCRELFVNGTVMQELEQMKLRITAEGVRRIK